jgi:glycosyltransferase involved in cell wall biosynthesis
VNRYASRCRALLFPGEEDFGMVPREVNAAGRPVIAFRGGGAIETVVDGLTGVFFNKATTESLVEAIEDFESRTFRQQALRRHAEKFDRSVFAFRVLQFLSSVAPTSCAAELSAGARLLSGNVAARAWPRLAVAR